MKLIFKQKACILSAVLVLIFTQACKKKTEFKEEDGQDAIDTRTVQGENDAVQSDVNNAIYSQPLLISRPSVNDKVHGTAAWVRCGLSLDSSQVTSGKLVLNYDGTTCNNRKREGQVKISILGYPSVKWKNENAVLKIEYINYKVTRVSDGKFILLNGIVNITNKTPNGGTWYDLVALGKASIIHEVKGTGIKVKYENSLSAADYNIHRRYTYTYSNLVFTCKGEGIGTNDGVANLENWGTTRKGVAFTSQVTSPVVWNTTCGGGAPIDGEIVIKVNDKSFEMRCIFAVNSGGDEITVAPNSCAYGWKVEWKYKKKTKNRIFVYN